MAGFLICAAAMLVVALAFVLVPLLRQRGAPSADARRHRALEEARAAGIVDADEYARKKAALGEPATMTPQAGRRTTLAATLLVALLLPAGALLLYRLVGAPQALDARNLAPAPAGDAGHGPQMEQAIATLAARLAQKPDDVQGWTLLGRAYQATDRAGESLDAWRHAHALAPDDPAIGVEYAQALALAAPDHRIDGEARAVLEAIAKKDAANQRALWLLGIADYQAQKFASAIARWNTLLRLLDAKSDVAASVRRQIAEAAALRDGKSAEEAQAIAAQAEPARADGSTKPAAAGSPSDAAGATPGDAVAAAGTPQLAVAVSLDPRLAASADPDATLFVFARAAKGPPMPLAIRRLKASQLPVTITLDDSMGMLPTMKLSMFPQVVVGARISRSGNALPQSGDLQALSAPIDVHRKDPVVLTIDQQVP